MVVEWIRHNNGDVHLPPPAGAVTYGCFSNKNIQHNKSILIISSHSLADSLHLFPPMIVCVLLNHLDMFNLLFLCRKKLNFTVLWSSFIFIFTTSYNGLSVFSHMNTFYLTNTLSTCIYTNLLYFALKLQYLLFFPAMDRILVQTHFFFPSELQRFCSSVSVLFRNKSMAKVTGVHLS